MVKDLRDCEKTWQTEDGNSILPNYQIIVGGSQIFSYQEVITI